MKIINMNLLDPISTIMTKDVYTLTPECSIGNAQRLFENHKIHHIPVVSDLKLVGMVSKSDFYFFKRGFIDKRLDTKIEDIRMKNYTVSSIMTEGLGKMEPTDRINVALEIFMENIFHAIPVVEGDKLVGIVTTYDIIKHLARDKEIKSDYSTKV